MEERHECIEAGGENEDDDGRDAQHECEEQLQVHGGLLGGVNGRERRVSAAEAAQRDF